jgi:hypothetical protein
MTVMHTTRLTQSVHQMKSGEVATRDLSSVPKGVSVRGGGETSV